MTTATATQAELARLVSDALKSGTSHYGQGTELTGRAPMGATTDQLSALAGHVTREYGDYGYVFEQFRQITRAVVLAQVRHFDGSRFIIAADKWGNVRRLDNSSRDQMASEIAGMHEHAVTP